ncbi:peptidoglycan DD-metalloendopeptidase family protein [Shimia sp. R9_1]|uniref:murein hydrolase activator EnvC family protein n=1 Tax=Shimia sp. R9_1 TaxID=2821111 RepID=UPI001ADA4D04|nr:peptidoglycan DD-metalloendopeptidase family protein [Shimia sp. R9_1]MBO9407599.1 peptidoglycan DD-metalloendopeptidase family protein [Shimia sp. R9_1]
MRHPSIFAAALGLWLTTTLALAETNPSEAAREAATQLEEASVALAQAKSSRDRVKSLTKVVHAYETGLTALRAGLRRASIREAQLSKQLKAQETEIASLLGVLQSMSSGPAPVVLVHPGGPMGTARSGMIIAEVTPALEAKAAQVRRDLEEVTILRSLQEGAAETLQIGLTGAQDARTALSKAIADRKDPPLRFVEDPVQTALLIASTETLEGFASALVDLQIEGLEDVTLPDVNDRKGQLALPVASTVLRRAGEADAAGIRRPGLVLATRPSALVVTPTPATIRYRGPLLDFGNVMILEPQPGVLFILAGLEQVFGDVGQVLSEGAPVGLMGGNGLETGAILSQSGDGSGNARPETLYIEVREGKSPVDPETWFQTNEDG